MSIPLCERMAGLCSLRSALRASALAIILSGLSWLSLRAGVGDVRWRQDPAGPPAASAPQAARAPPAARVPCAGLAWWRELQAALLPGGGKLLCPGSGRFAALAATFNTRLRLAAPAAVAVPASAAQVPRLLRLAASHGLAVAAHGGGHGPAGAAAPAGALVLSLRRLRGVKVHAARRELTAEGGAIWQDVNNATKDSGLAAVGGGCPLVGVVGFLLGGGISWLSRSRGLGSDQLISAEVALANGSVVRAAAGGGGDVDLFWALRGGGHHGGLGIVLSVTLRLHPTPRELLAGKWCFPSPSERDALQLLRPILVAEEVGMADRRFYAHPSVMRQVRERSLATSQWLAATGAVCWYVLFDGSPDEGAAVGAPFFNALADAAAGPARTAEEQADVRSGRAWRQGHSYASWANENNVTKAHTIWKSVFLGRVNLTGWEAITRAVWASPWVPEAGKSQQKAAGRFKCVVQVEIEHVGGAIAANSGGAYAHRQARRLLSINAISSGDGEGVGHPFVWDAALGKWARGVAAAALPFAVRRNAAFSNYADPDLAGHSWEEAYFADRATRLRKLKTRYDPSNLFRAPLRAAPLANAAAGGREAGRHPEKQHLAGSLPRQPGAARRGRRGWASKASRACPNATWARPVHAGRAAAPGRLSGQTCAVIGASASGLGGQAAKQLAALGCHVLLATSSERSCEDARLVVAQAAAAAGRGGSAECLPAADLSEPSGAFSLSQHLAGGVDALVLCAATSGPFRPAAPSWPATHGGDKRTLSYALAVGHLSHVLLVHLLAAFGALRPGCRVVAVSNGAALGGAEGAARSALAGGNYSQGLGALPAAWNHGPRAGKVWARAGAGSVTAGEIAHYTGIKLLNALLMAELSRRAALSGLDIDAAAAVPDVSAHTGMTAKYFRDPAFARQFLMPNEGGVDEAALPLVYLAAGLHKARLGGRAFVQCLPAPRRPAEGERLEACAFWEEARALAGVPPGLAPALDAPEADCSRLRASR